MCDGGSFCGDIPQNEPFFCLFEINTLTLHKTFEDMTTAQLQLNEELFETLTELSQDEDLMRKAVKALKRILAKAQKDDPTLMTKEEFFARIEEASQGPSMTFDSVEELDAYIRSL